MALAMPMGTVPLGTARSVWLPIQICIVLWCASRLWILYGGPPRYIVRAYCMALLWMPTLVALRMGQLSPVILLGLVGFLWLLSLRREVAAGAFFALTAVKPQLVAVIWVPFLLWALAERRWNVLAGTTGCMVAASIAAVSTNHAVFTQYERLMMSAPPTIVFESPNLGTVLRLASGTAESWPQFVPTCLGAAAVGLIWHRRRAVWDWRRELPGLVLMSTFLTSYGGWTFDLVTLLVPIIAVATLAVRSGRKHVVTFGGVLFLAVSSLAYVMHMAAIPQFAFIWMTPTVALSSFLLARLADTRVRPSRRTVPS